MGDKQMAMDRKDMRLLDAWIAEHAFGITVKWDAGGAPYNAEAMIGSQIVGWIHPYSRDAHVFTHVKREIEQRGWDWGIGYHYSRPRGNRYDFLIYAGARQLGHSYAETEELAGCEAFKLALMKSDE